MRGNSDDPWKNCGEKSHGLEYAQRVGIANKNFFVTHGDRSSDDDETIFKGRMPQQIMSVYRDQLKGVHFVITGHSHHQHFIEYEGIKFINPGAIFIRRFGNKDVTPQQCCVLEIDRGTVKYNIL